MFIEIPMISCAFGEWKDPLAPRKQPNHKRFYTIRKRDQQLIKSSFVIRISGFTQLFSGRQTRVN